jgi:uncharacterized protein
MSLHINLRHLEAHEVRLEGELAVEELDIDTCDEVIRLTQPLQYRLVAQKLEEAVLLTGRLTLRLDCECVRCLKPFAFPLRLDPWACHLPLEGEDAVPVINDTVDLTPFVREDILLELPQHPLCGTECRGLPKRKSGKAKNAKSAGPPETGSPAWAELNKLKL